MQRSLKRELQDYVDSLRESGKDLASVSAAAFSKARKKLRYTAFVELIDVFTASHYRYGENLRHWKGYRVLATDGSTVEVPNTPDNLALWGTFKQRGDGKKVCMARTLEVYDVLNRLVVAADIDGPAKSESGLLWGLMPKLANLPQAWEGAGDLFVFDRYFASHLLIFYLHACNKDFCFRMKKDWWKVCESFLNSGMESMVFTLGLPKKYMGQADGLGIMDRKIQVRLVRIELEGGETEVLLTSLTDEGKVTVADLKVLYHLRWPIETRFLMLKHRVQLENFSGKSINAVKQDYFAKILMLNIASAVANPIDALLRDKPKKKYVHQTNFTNVVGIMKKAVVEWFLKGNLKQSLDKMIGYLLKTTEPIREGRKFQRPKLQKRKYHRNYCQA